MIIVTGAAGFIGSCVASRLNQAGYANLILTDNLRENDKWKNLRHLNFEDYLDRAQVPDFLKGASGVEAIIHMGACSSTTERDAGYLMENNYRYTLRLAQHCLQHNIRFIYASSAATYGGGEKGYEDDEARLPELLPLNMYGYSKQVFDLKARRQGWLSKICGLKFFNVYGPNEYFKDDMASVIFKAFNQIRESGRVRLFKSHRPEFKDGEQLRDFVYVKDVVEAILFLLQHPQVSGVFNIGSGRARSFNDLVTATFNAMGLPVNIEYIDMPPAIRDRYQYFTEAKMNKLRGKGFDKLFHSLEDGVKDYVQNYLMKDFKQY
jgi:ADP-L-glycero-D-manno-heptose 6-epimerase